MNDYYTIRIPRCVGWRTLAVNAAFVLVGAALILSGKSDMGGALCLAGLVNIAMRLCARTPVADRANPLAAIWSPKRADQPVTHGLVAQVDAVRPVARDDRDVLLLTELADEMAAYDAAMKEVTGVDDVLRHLTSKPHDWRCGCSTCVMVRAEEREHARLEAAAARMATAPRADGYRASTVVCAFLGTFCASFLSTLAVMVA